MDWLWDIFDFTPVIGGKAGLKVMQRGQPANARLVGIQVEARSSNGSDAAVSEPDYIYTLDVAPRDGSAPFRAGVRQRIRPARHTLTIGRVVPVVVHRGDVVIDWERALGGQSDLASRRFRWKMTDPPGPGITDLWRRRQFARMAGGEQLRVTVLAANEIVSVHTGSTGAFDIDIEVARADGRLEQQRIANHVPPDYARHLVTRGAILPGGYDKGNVAIDWQRAANGEVGHDPEPPAVQMPAPATTTGFDKFAGFMQSVHQTFAPQGDPNATDGITLEQYADITGGFVRDRVPKAGWDEYAQQFGVARGAWSRIDAAWTVRVNTDDVLGTRYAELFQAACKKRR